MKDSPLRGAATATMTATAHSGVAPDAALILALLDHHDASFDARSVDQAVAQLQHAFGDAGVAEWLRAVLARAQVPGQTPVVIDWRHAGAHMLPALAQLDGCWYWIATAGLGRFVLVDSNDQQRECDASQLADAVLLKLKARTEPAPKTGNRAARMMLRELFRHPGWLWKVVLATILVNLLAVASSLYSMQVYDRVVPTFAWSTLTTLTVGVGLVFLLDCVLKNARAKILDSLACAVDRRTSQQVFEHLLHTALDGQPRSVGTLAAQIGSLESVRQFFSSSVIFGLVDLPFALMFLAFIAIIGGKVAWVYALLLPIGLGIALLAHRQSRELIRRQMARSNERQGLLVDAIRGAESIRAANAGWRFAQEWQAVTSSVSAYAIRQKAQQGTMAVSIGLLSSMAYVAAIVVGVFEVEAGQLSTGGIVACSLIGGRVITPVMQGIQYLVQWEQVRQALQMVDQVLALEPERRPGQSLLSPSFNGVPPSLLAEDLRYGYPGAQVMQLKLNAPLTLRAGERVLVLGSVGSGKSTLLKLLGGLYRPREGRVKLAGHDLWEIDPQVLVTQVGYLPQETHLFKGTLRENLALSGVASDAQVNALCVDLGIDRMAAASPSGMDLRLAEGGGGLSGGQRQLVALGRLMLARPRVWLLDEPTAALDADSEMRAWRALAARLRPDDILLVATHKPQFALRLATRVLVMKDGEIVRDGTPAELFPQAFATPPDGSSPANQQKPEVGHVA